MENAGMTPAATTDLDVTALTYDFAAKMKGFAYEYNYSKLSGKDSDNSGVGKASTDFYRHQLSYTLPSGLMFGYRYAVMDESTGANSRGDNHTETTYGISKYFAGHNLKIQADYVELVEEKAGKDATDDIIRIQAHLKF